MCQRVEEPQTWTLHLINVFQKGGGFLPNPPSPLSLSLSLTGFPYLENILL